MAKDVSSILISLKEFVYFLDLHEDFDIQFIILVEVIQDRYNAVYKVRLTL